MVKKADMHVHSFHSDGTFDIKEILKEAENNNVSLLSITDHNCLQAYDDLKGMNNTKIKIITGVELDAVDYGINFHILGYGMDISDEPFCEFVCKNNERLETVNTELIKKITKDYENVSLEDYQQYAYNRRKGGWKLLHYLAARGVSSDMYDSLSIYSRYDHSYTCANFLTVKEVVKEIHRCKGKAILAHPGKVLPCESSEQFELFIERLFDCHDLDGIECYYPLHSEKITNICLKICAKRNLLITCGSDCHGNFENTEIGELNVSEDMLNIEGLSYIK